MKISAYYARNSTDKQKSDKTIDSQISEIQERLLKDGNILGKELDFVDEGWSGSIIERPALENLRDKAKDGLFEVLYLYDIGRLSRDFAHQMLLLDELKKAGVEIISLHDINAETPEQQMMQRVMGVFHDFERVKIAERFRRGKTYKAKNGILFGWNAPYGYKYIKGNKKKGILGKFDIEEHEARVVKMIFEWVGNEGMTVRSVIRKLQELGIEPQKSKKSVWATSTVCRLVKDESYIGTTYYNRRKAILPKNPTGTDKFRRVQKTGREIRPKEEWNPIKIPRIITDELFQKVQLQLSKNQKFAKRNSKSEYLFSKLIYCSCGCTRSGQGNRKRGIAYYRCNDRIYNFPLPPECTLKGVNAVVLDSLGWEKLTSLLLNPKLIKEYADKWEEKEDTVSSTEGFNYDDTKHLLDRLTEEEKRYQKAFGEGLIDIEQLREHILDVKSRKAVIQATVQQNIKKNSPSQHVKLPNLVELCDTISHVISDLSFDEKMQIVREVVEKVTTDGKEVTISGYIPLEITESETTQTQKFTLRAQSRNSRPSQRRQINPFQCTSTEGICTGCKLSLCNNRSKHRRD